MRIVQVFRSDTDDHVISQLEWPEPLQQPRSRLQATAFVGLRTKRPGQFNSAHWQSNGCGMAKSVGKAL